MPLRNDQARDSLAERVVRILGLHAAGLLWYNEQDIEIQVTSAPTAAARRELNSVCEAFGIKVRIVEVPGLAGSEQPPLINHHKWRLEYRARRYLEYVSEEKLFTRMRHAMENTTTLTPDGKIGVRLPTDDGFFFTEIFTHALEEMELRGIDRPPNGFLKGANVPQPGFQAPTAIRNYPKPLDGCLFKFSKMKYLKRAISKGAIRINPASTYADPSLNNAIRDSELELTIFMQPEEAILRLDDKRRLAPTGLIELKANVESNYYVYCLGEVCDPRLFNDFDADSVLIIRDREEFLRRLITGVEDQVPDWKGVHAGVAYIDPYIAIPGALVIVHFTKHVHYFYQREYRVVWFPPPGKIFDQLEPIDVEIGALSDICDLVEL